MEARVLSTRRGAGGLLVRRRERADGVRFSTIEVPLAVWTWINRQGRARDREAEVLRVWARSAVKAAAIQHAAEGWKAIASAHELGVALRTVQRWRKAEAQAKKETRPARGAVDA